MKIRSLATATLLTGSSLMLVGCGGKEKQKQIDALLKDIELTEQSFENERKQHRAEREENDELREENNTLKMQVREAEGRAKVAERELERAREREALAKQVKERAPSSREKLEASKKTAQNHLSATVTITGDQSSGSGLLVTADEKTWIYLPASFLTGNTKLEVKTADGTPLSGFGTFELAADADLARLEVKDEVTSTLTPAANSELKSGTPLLGVDENGTLVDGRSYGAETTKIKADSRFRSCPSGAPAFSGESAELVGIFVPQQRDDHSLWKSDRSSYRADYKDICRVDRPIKWSAIPIAAFMEEAKTLAEADQLTRLILAFASTDPSPGGIAMDGSPGGAESSREILDRNKSMSAVRSLFSLDEWLEEKGERASKADIARRISGVYGDVLRTASRKSEALSKRRFSSYHAAAAAKSVEWRKDAEKKLKATASSLE